MGILANIVIMFSCWLLLGLLLGIFKFIHKSWWIPIRIQRLMRSQGIEGPCYEFINGNTKEINRMRKQSMEKPMIDLTTHNIFPRILPHVHTWKNTYGMNILNWHGSQAELIVTEPKLIKEILNNKDGDYPKIDLEGYAKKLLGDGLSATKGEKWTKLRKIANHAFHAESLKNMIPEMIQCTQKMLEKWENYEGKEVEVFEEFRVLTSEIISKTAFGISYLEGRTIFDMLMKLTIIVSRNAQNIRFPLLGKFFKIGDDIESNKIEQRIEECIMDIIKKRDGAKSGDEAASFGNDFLGKLLEENHDDDKSKCISIEEIVDECKTFYFAGHETTTSLLTWTIFLLAVHTDWQEKARREVLQLFGKNIPTSDGISRLKTMNMIVEESLRLYPPVPFIKRKVTKEVKLGNLSLPNQMQLYISPLALHHDPLIWGEDVHLFKPDRFVSTRNNNSAAVVAFLPFGFGARTCVGLSFAITEAKIVLSMILQRYVFTLSSTYLHSPVQIFMIRPQHGVQVVLHAI